jgi:hypothetical protein
MSKTKPDSFFVEPISFQTLNENYSLRYEPITTDEVPPVLHQAVDNEKSLRGNVTAVYPKGAIGKAWARKKDSTGREWWLVEMEPLKYLSFDAYYSLDDFPTHYIGWMSSRFVKRID